MVTNDNYFPIRYENSRPFISELNGLFGQRTFKEINNDSFVMKVQNIIYDSIPSDSLPIGTQWTQSDFELQLARELNFYYLFHDWNIRGRNIFHFSKEILTMFDNTDVDDIPLENIHLPYQSFYLSFSELDKQFGTHRDLNLFIDGVLVTKDLGKENRIDFFFAPLIKDEKKSQNWFVENRYSPILNSWFRINYDSEKNTLKKAGFVSKAFGEDKSELKIENTKNHFWNYIGLALNAICYISTKQQNEIVTNWTDDTPRHLIDNLSKAKTKKQKERITTELKNIGFSKIKFLGQEYRNSEFSIDSCDKSTHWRRGFWRNQGYGKDHKERFELIWIPPTIVNKEKGEVNKGHIYKV